MQHRLSEFTRSKALPLARYCQAFAGFKYRDEAARHAAGKWPEDSRIAEALKALPGTSADPDSSGGWGSELSAYGISDGFLELLSATTVVDRMAADMRRVPPRTQVLREMVSPLAGWVAKAAAKPVTEAGYDTVAIDISCIAAIVVLVRDLVISSRPSATDVIGAQLTNAVAFAMDHLFLDPSIAAVPDQNPASITHGATSHVSSGATAADIAKDLSLLVKDQTDGGVKGGAWYLVMQPRSAVSLAALHMTDSGAGLSFGPIPILTSVASPAGQITLIDASEILLADEGRMRVDHSSDASIDLAGGNSPTHSNYQKNTVSIRCER